MADDEDFGELFLRANANVDYMADRLADCLRNCMRAVASGDSSLACYRAVQDFDILLKLMARSEGVRLYELFDKAIDQIRPSHPDFVGEGSASQYYESALLSTAEKGLQFLVERSCFDNAARGRASRRRSEFLDGIKGLEKARQEKVREAKARWQSTDVTPAKKARNRD